MNTLEQFKKKIERMTLIRRHHDEYQSVASNILKHLIEPRVEAVSDRFDGASVEVNAETGFAKLSFLPDRLPMNVFLIFRVRLDRSARLVRIRGEYCLSPYVSAYEPESSVTVSLKKPDFKKAEAFVEEKILKFLYAYQALQARNNAEDFFGQAVCG